MPDRKHFSYRKKEGLKRQAARQPRVSFLISDYIQKTWLPGVSNPQ
jgi:hypothetical protein